MRNARRRSGKTQAGRPDTEAGAARHRTESWPAARRLGGSAARRLGGSAARRLGGSAARRLGGSAARRLGGSADIIDRALSALVNPLGGLFSGECSGPAAAPSPTPYPPVSPLMAVSTRRRRFRPMVHAHGRRLASQPAPIYRWYTKCTPKSNASAAAAMRSPHSRCPPRRRPYPWCVSRAFGTGTRQMVHRKSRRRTPGAFGNGARRAVPHRKPRTARRTSRRFAAEHVRRYSCAEVTRSERWPRHQAVRYFHHAPSVRAASPDGRRAQVTSANARPEGAQGLAVEQVAEAVAALDTDENTVSNQHVSGVWRFHGQGRSPPAPLQRHAPRLDVIDYRGVPRLPRGHENPRRSRLAVCSLSLHRIRCGSSCLRRGVCPQDIAATAIRHWIAPFGAHVGFSRPRCQWQPCGWRHHTTPSREPHEPADKSFHIQLIENDLFRCSP